MANTLMRLFIALVLMLPSIAFPAVTVTVNGTSHTIPQTNEKGWGNNVTAWIQAISQYSLQPNGGAFTLTAETDFGPNFGLKSIYLKSRATNPSGSGVLRLGNAEEVSWRNAANSANLGLSVNASNQLTFNGVVLSSSTGPLFDDSLFTIYDNADPTKLLQFQLSGIPTASTRTITIPNASTTLLGTDNTASVTSKTINADSNTITNIDDGEIKSGAAINAAKIHDGSISNTEFGRLDNISGNIQTLIDGKTDKSTLTTKGDLYCATGAGTIARLGVGSDGQSLQADSAQSCGVKWSAPATIAIGDSITSATAGSLLFAGTSGVLAQDNSNLFYDNANDILLLSRTTNSGRTTSQLSADSGGENGGATFSTWSTNDAHSPILDFQKSASSSVGTNSIVASGEDLGYYIWRGANGTGFTDAANIFAQVDGTPGASNDMPGRLIFATTADGAGSATERLRIHSSGRITANSINNNASGCGAGSTTPEICSGTYTPTLTNGTNVAASTAYPSFYQRVGNVVTVSYQVDVDPTSASTQTNLGISLPIASNFASGADSNGTCSGSNSPTFCMSTSDAANDRVTMSFSMVSVSNSGFVGTFVYVVK